MSIRIILMYVVCLWGLLLSYWMGDVLIFGILLWGVLMALLCHLLDYLQQKDIYVFIRPKN